MCVLAASAFFNNLLKDLSMLFVTNFVNTVADKRLGTTAIAKFVEPS